MRKYVDDYGIGPWKIYEFNPGNAKDLREYGQPVKRSWRLAVAMVGQLQWELIEPLDDESAYARFLAEKGGGVHHTSPSLLRASTKCWQWRPNEGLMWSSAASSKASGLRSRFDRLRERGLLTISEVAQACGVSTKTISEWRQKGMLRGHAINDRNQFLKIPDRIHPKGTLENLRTRSRNARVQPGLFSKERFGQTRTGSLPAAAVCGRNPATG